jgi:hypothetical protein
VGELSLNGPHDSNSLYIIITGLLVCSICNFFSRPEEASNLNQLIFIIHILRVKCRLDPQLVFSSLSCG